MFRADESRLLSSAKDGTKLNEIDADDKTNEIVYMEYLKQENMVLAINGDQNVFVYDIHQGADKRTFDKLSLAKQQCYYLDEIIDVKFIN